MNMASKIIVCVGLACAMAACVSTDDGKDYRLLALKGNKLLFTERRKPVIRPVVAVPVEECPIEIVSFTPAENLNEFDQEVLREYRDAVRLSHVKDGCAREARFGGLSCEELLARERVFRPPVAPNGFGRWNDAEDFASLVATNGVRRKYEDSVDVLRQLVDEEMVRPVARSADGKNPLFRRFVEDGITNRVLKNLAKKTTVRTGAIDLDEFKFGVMLWIGGFAKPESNLVKLMKIYSGVKIKPELNGEVNEKLHALEREMDVQPGNEFTQFLLANALIASHRRNYGDLAIHPPDATNLSHRITALAVRYSNSPARTRAVYELTRTLISRPAKAGSSSYGYSFADRRHLVSCLRASNADSWLADVYEGMLELDLGLYGKGDVFDYCSKDDWPQKVYPHLLRAREAFFRAWKRHPELPEGAYGMLAVEWELYHSHNAARWLGWLWHAELDTPWAYTHIRHCMLTYFPKEKKQFDLAYKAIATAVRNDLEEPYRIAESEPPTKAPFLAFPLTNEWREASFVLNDPKVGFTPYKDAGKRLDMQYDPERRAPVWAVRWADCRMPLSHEGEIEAEFVEPFSVTNRVAFGFSVYATTRHVFTQLLLLPDGTHRTISFCTNLGSEPQCYPLVTGEKYYDSPVKPAARKFKLRYRIDGSLLCAWLDGKLIQSLWHVKEIRDNPPWSQHSNNFKPALLGTGVKIHSVRYRKIPANAGLEEFVP